MGTLSTIDPRWIAADGTDRGTPRPLGDYGTALRALGLMAAALDAAADMHERGDIERDDIEDTARSIVGRIMTAAHREPRALHTYWHGNVTTGETSSVAPAPDVHERVRAHRRTVRTNRGETVQMVTVHGRAYVIGRTDDVRPHREHSMSAPRAAAMLDDVTRAAVGRDALDVYRATQVLYGTSIPALIGADVLTFHEFSSWDDVRARTPRRGHGTRYRLPTVRARATDDVRPGERLAAADRVDIERVAVPADIERDDRGRVVYSSGGPRVRTVTVPRSVVFSGHRLIERGASYRDLRAQRARGVDDALIVRPTDDLAHVLASVAAAIEHGPYRATWEHGTRRGALTLSTRGAWSVTGIGNGAPRQVKARSAAALERAIARY